MVIPKKANMFNYYFSSQTLINNQNKHLPHLDLITDKTLEYITISEQEVRDVLENLDSSKAHGPDHVSLHFFKEGAPALSKPLSTVFNRSLQQGYFPPLWKDGYLTYIHKKANYRPICLLDPVGKIMERCVHKHLFNYIQDNKLLTPFRSGFVPGDSRLINYYTSTYLL